MTYACNFYGAALLGKMSSPSSTRSSGEVQSLLRQVNERVEEIIKLKKRTRGVRSSTAAEKKREKCQIADFGSSDVVRKCIRSWRA